MSEEYLHISINGLKQVANKYNQSDAHQHINWTTDNSIELPICMKKTGPGSEQPITLIQYFKNNCVKFLNKPALSTKKDGKWVTRTHGEYYNDVMTFATALMSLGVSEMSGINILGFNAPEWNISFYGSVMGRYMPVGVYTTNNAEAVFYVADHSDCEVLVIDTREQLKKIISVWDRLPKLKAVVIYNDHKLPATEIPPNRIQQVYQWNDFMNLAKNYKGVDTLQSRIDKQQPGHCCSLIYTSGTTGNPKGVMLSHDNYVWPTIQIMQYREVIGDQRVVSYLPLSHVAAQMIDIVGGVLWGTHVYFAQPDALQGSLIQTLQEIRPTFFFSVPRVWEKIYDKMQEVAKSNGAIKTKIATWAKSIGKQATFAQYHKQPNPTCFTLADKVVYHNVKKTLGLDQAKYMIFGAAPLSPQIRDYFLSLNMYLINGYGMSECTGAQTLADPENFDKFDEAFLTSTGRSITGSEIMIDNPDKDGNGEICYRGRHIFMGYYKDPESTRKTLDNNRYLHSGDVGRLDSRGNLQITGRIKELLITAGGENVAPVLIEDEIKKAIKIISNAMVVGDARKYLAVIITLKYKTDKEGKFTEELTDDVLAELQSIGCQGTTYVQIKDDKAFQKYILSGLDKANSKVISKAQSVKKFCLVPGDFTVDAGDLTPTLKLKRKEVLKKWANEVENMYIDANL